MAIATGILAIKGSSVAINKQMIKMVIVIPVYFKLVNKC